MPANTQTVVESVLDSLVEKFSNEQISQSEKTLLDKAYWLQGQPVRLRDDHRFHQTPWGNWLVTSDNQLLVNDWLYEQFVSGVYIQASLIDCLDNAASAHKKTVVFCQADPRFKKNGDVLKLDSSLLSKRPHFINEPDEGRFVTHLPYYDLKVVAASEPAGEWGASAKDNFVDEEGFLECSLPTESWMRVDLGATKLNNNMFVSRIHGHSMDDGRRGLVDNALVVFEYWPKGSRQNKLVVVRGAFHDAETGSYALKQYQSDVRNEQGEHQTIILHSLNSDKTRYPDIHLKPEMDDDLVVVAEYLHVLGESEYTREPKPAVADGERDIHDDEVNNQRTKSLGEIHQRVFSDEQTDDSKHTAEVMSGLTWVCLAVDEGGAALEISPLTFIPKFVKKLELQYADNVDILLASNHRHHSKFKDVYPGATEYRLLPSFDFVDEFDDEFSSWKVSGLNKESIHWFRVDASGVGRSVSGESWSIGSTYRALALTEMFANIPESHITLLKHEWSMLEFELGTELPEWLLPLIDGNTETKRPLQLSWITTSPVAWKKTENAQDLAVFNTHSDPVLSIKLPNNIDSEIKPGVLVLLRNGEDSEALTFTDGKEWHFQLTNLQPGNYVVQVIPADKQLAPEYMPFIVDDSIELMPAVACFTLDATDRDGEEVNLERLISKQDWSKLDNNLSFCNELIARLPPHWPLRISLQGSVYITGGSCRTNEDGELDLLGEMTYMHIHTHLNQYSAMHIKLDAGELGNITLAHYHPSSPKKIQSRISELWSEFTERKAQLLADAELLIQFWLTPLFEEWGGQLQLVPDEDLLEVSGTRRLFQWVSCEWEDDTVLAHHIPVLLVADENDDKLGSGGQLRVACNKWLIARKQRRMLITDGLRFAELRKNSHQDLIWFDIGTMNDDLVKTKAWLGELEGGA